MLFTGGGDKEKIFRQSGYTYRSKNMTPLELVKATEDRRLEKSIIADVVIDDVAL